MELPAEHFHINFCRYLFMYWVIGKELGSRARRLGFFWDVKLPVYSTPSCE